MRSPFTGSPTPRWSQCALKTTASSFSLASLPSILPITLRVSTVRTLAGTRPRIRSGKIDGAEARRIGAFQQLIHRGADGGRDLLADLFGHPSGEGQRGLTGSQLHFLIFATPGGSHHFPAVAGRRRGVDDDHGGGAVTRGFFVFIGPAAVVGERRAGEKLGIVRKAARR